MAGKQQQGKQNDFVSFILKNLWFYLFYFAVLLLIASFGLIAEA
jgi:hypothetical protein